MNASCHSRETVLPIIRRVRNKGVTLWAEHGHLRYRAPRGALSIGELQELRAASKHIVTLLEESAAGTSSDVPADATPALLPLTFSQTAHWNTYRLHERPAIRQIASATRLRGRLHSVHLSEIWIEIVRRHDALRTCIEFSAGVPMQRVSTSAAEPLQLEDLRGLPNEAQEHAVREWIEHLILQPIDPCVGPLFEGRLLRLVEEHVLVVVMEHMISDAFSLNIFLQELFDAYSQRVRGMTVRLPPVGLQFSQYALRQRASHDAWRASHGKYWMEGFKQCRRSRFPADGGSTEAGIGWGEVSVRVDAALKRELQNWSRERCTTAVMAVFTAYAATVLRWCRVSETVIVYQTDGRIGADEQNTIGYLAGGLHLRVRLGEQETFVDLIRRVTAEFCNAYENADASYLEAVPGLEYTRNSRFNWVPQGNAGPFLPLEGTDDELICSPVRFTHPMRRTLQRDTEPSIQLFEMGDEVMGEVLFPLSLHSHAQMERFGANFLALLNALLKSPDRPIAQVEVMEASEV